MDEDRSRGMWIVVEYAGRKGKPQWHPTGKSDWNYLLFGEPESAVAPDEVAYPESAWGPGSLMPVSASSQVAFALGYLRAGIGGAFAATAGFRYIPGALASSVALIIALAAFGLLQFWKWPPWLLVLLSGIAGFVFLRQ
jgi:hypothetical protein